MRLAWNPTTTALSGLAHRLSLHHIHVIHPNHLSNPFFCAQFPEDAAARRPALGNSVAANSPFGDAPREPVAAAAVGTKSSARPAGSLPPAVPRKPTTSAVAAPLPEGSKRGASSHTAAAAPATAPISLASAMRRDYVAYSENRNPAATTARPPASRPVRGAALGGSASGANAAETAPGAGASARPTLRKGAGAARVAALKSEEVWGPCCRIRFKGDALVLWLGTLWCKVIGPSLLLTARLV